jgi:outer membrane protein OmpA-like peptidoglycan-associated protein
MIKTRLLAGTALVTLLIAGQMGIAQAQSYRGGAGQSDVEVNLDALDALPGSPSANEPVHLHPAGATHHVKHTGAYESEYSDTTVVNGGGVANMALETPEAPAPTTPVTTAKPVTHHTHVRHRRRRGHTLHAEYTAKDPEGLNPAIAKLGLDPAVLSSSDLNRLQILCSAVPTGSGRSPLEPASYTTAPSLSVAPRASLDAIPVPAGSSSDNTSSLNGRELAMEQDPPQTLGPANIPGPTSIAPQSGPSAAEARQARRPGSPMPVNTPPAAQPASPPVPDETDTTMAALPDAPTTPVAPMRDVQAVAMQAPAAPSAGSKPLSNDDLRVDFQPGGAVVPSGEIPKLDAVVDRLTTMPDLRIELRAYASQSDSASKARRTSLARALAVKSYLTGKGISEDRIDVRALGAPDQTATDRVDLFMLR